jgi:hypothetical protein
MHFFKIKPATLKARLCSPFHIHTLCSSTVSFFFSLDS